MVKDNIFKRKIISWSLVFIMAASMLPVLFLISLNEVSGESLVKIGNGGVMYAKSKLGKGADGRYYYCSPYGDGSRELKLQIKRKGVYHICYCINPWNTINTGSGYKANSYAKSVKLKETNRATREYLGSIMAFSYNKGRGDGVSGTNGNDYYMATQMIIWQFVTGHRSNVKDKFTPYIKDGYYKAIRNRPAWKSYLKILANAKKYYYGPSFKGKTIKLKETSPGSGKFRKTIADVKGVGLSAVIMNGVSVKKNGNKYTFALEKEVPKNKAKMVTFKMNVNTGLPADQKPLIFDPVRLVSRRQGLAYGSNLPRRYKVMVWSAATLKDKQRPGELKIVKKTSDGSPVNGFKFFVKGKTSAGKSFEKIFGPTDENGIIVNDIDAGTYEITELMDKDQNLKYRRPESRTVTLEDGDDETIEFENEVKTGNGRILKTADDGHVGDITFNIKGTADWGEYIETNVTTSKAEYSEVKGEEKVTENSTEDSEQQGNDIKQESELEGSDAPGEFIDEAGEIIDTPDEIVSDNETGNSIKEIEDRGGKCGISDFELPAGEYVITEVNPAPALYKDTTPVNITVNDGDHIYIKFHNVRKYSIKTSAVDIKNGTNTAFAEKNARVVDNVKLTGLRAGDTYTVVGRLMHKNGSKSVKEVKSADDKAVISAKTFKAEDEAETVNISYDFDAHGMAGKDIVVYEYLLAGTKTAYVKENKIIDIKKLKADALSAEDNIDNEEQTIHFPLIRTTATVSGSHRAKISNEPVEIVDEVSYGNLTPGEKYTLTGELMDANTGKPIGVKVKHDFIPEKVSGKENIIFKYRAAKAKKSNLVVFETLTARGKIVGEHRDLKDRNQTVEFTDEERSSGLNVKTGDENRMSLFVIFTVMLVAGSGIIALYSGRRN